MPKPAVKPAKPYPTFPLFAHANGSWVKKIKGGLYYFGPWADPDAALAKYLAEKDQIWSTGRRPQSPSGRLTIKALVNRFMSTKDLLVDNGELSPRTWDDYYYACQFIFELLGRERTVETLVPDDFIAMRAEMSKRWGLSRLGKMVRCVRLVFRHAVDNELITHPVRFGPAFREPPAKVLRLQRAQRGGRMFEAAELRKILKAVEPPMRAMVLLGLNCGLGNHDVGLLRTSNLDLKAGWLTLVRSKTGIARRCPLWPETVAALKAALAGRTTPRDDANASLVFVTKRGLPWTDDTRNTPVSRAFRWVLQDLELYKPGLSFYTLRHVHRTIADEAKDQPAANALMGHTDGTMADVYRERIDDKRLQAVANHVRAWLFKKPKKGKKPARRK